ncbi:hypothetical protein [Acinetobacter soli]|nr:hypothetical protein [Acinetobacter soli]MEB4800684.1 hypothetical protein [Acinetobacter soli]
MQNYLTLDEAIDKLKVNKGKNLSTLITQGVVTPAFYYVGYIVTIADGKAVNSRYGTYILKPKLSNELIALINGQEESIKLTWVATAIQIKNKAFDDQALELNDYEDISFILYDYDVEESPISLPTDVDAFFYYQPAKYSFTVHRSMLVINEQELNTNLVQDSEKKINNSEVRNLRIIGAMLLAIKSSKSRSLTQDSLAYLIEDMTKGTGSGMSKSSLDKVFSEANKAVRPFLKNK